MGHGAHRRVQGDLHAARRAVPAGGIGPTTSKVRELLARLEEGGTAEVILATNPKMSRARPRRCTC